MLLVGIEKNQGSLVLIRHLPARERKNWNRASGPILRLAPDFDRDLFSALVENHFDEFERLVEPQPSEFDAMSPEERRKFFASHRFASIESNERILLVSPSQVLVTNELSIRFGPPEKVLEVPRPWKSEDLVQAVMDSIADSTNRVVD